MQAEKRKKVLFIDRDGTLVLEPADYQVDSFEKLEFYPHAFKYLARIAEELDYKLVMVTNQDGLGTDSHPEENFWPVHNFIIKAFENEGVVFAEQIIDKTFAHENAATRKPGVALLQHFFNPEVYDLENSFVIGDRITDVALAKNLNARAIWLKLDANLGADELEGMRDEYGSYIALDTTSWKEIYEFIKGGKRVADHRRTTRETDIRVAINLDGNGKAEIRTGLHFFDHMLDQIARHGNIDLLVEANGDLHIDEHHTIEDTAITLGEAFAMALGNKKGIERYGFCLPMDDCMAQVALDFGGRNWLVWNASFGREKIGDMPTEMFLHFFKSFSDAAKCNLNVQAEGENEHHKIEAIFKAFAKAIKMAVKRDFSHFELPSTKGVI